MKRPNLAILCLLLICLFGCSAKKQEHKTSTIVTSVEPPLRVAIKQPLPILLDNCPKPQSITIPYKPISFIKHTKSGDKTIQLSPPVTTTFTEGIAQGKCDFTNYIDEDDLAPQNITCGFMDKLGNLWFGTDGRGVSRYDGKSFTTYTMAEGLANNYIFCISQDQDGNLWFGTGGGKGRSISRYDGKSFTTYNSNLGITHNSALCITKDKAGNLWFGTDGGGVSRYDGKSFTLFTTAEGLAQNTVDCITVDKGGNLWFGTWGGGVSCYNGKSFTTYTTTQGLAKNNVNCITQDKKGNLWFGTQGGGVSRYDGKSFTTYTIADGLASNKVNCITEDKVGNLWFGTYGSGVSCYDGKSFTTYTIFQGLSNNYVYNITQDNAGNLWLGTYGGGICRYDGNSFIKYTTAEGLANNNVSTITEDKNGHLWFGTYGGGVSRYDGKSFTTYTTAQGLANNYVSCCAEDKTGNLWFGTTGNSGLSRYDGKSFTTYTTDQGLASNTVNCIVQDSIGNLWFGTSGGVSRYDGKSFTTYTTAQGLVNNYVLCGFEDKTGSLWFGTYGGGLSRYDGKSFTTYTTAKGLANSDINTITEDKTGNFWFGTRKGGLCRYDGNSFATFNKTQGLPNDDIIAVVIDKQENIVIETNFGIVVLKGFIPADRIEPNNSSRAQNDNLLPPQNALKNSELKSYRPVFDIYNSKTGYPIKLVNTGGDNGAMICDRTGIIWASSGNEKNALIRFDPSAVNHNPNPPQVILQSVKVDEANICWYAMQQPNENENETVTRAQQESIALGKVLSEEDCDSLRNKFSGVQFDGITSFYPLPKHLVLPYQHNHITFDFAAIEPSKPYLINYQWILIGYDKDWSLISNKTNATFGNISPGTYTFKLKAESPDGIWSAPVTYTFKVLPPWYRSWWAYIIYLLATCLILLAIYRWRTATLRKEKEALEQTVQERTAEVVKQKELVEEKNKDILDSITYAKRLQDAILPPLSLVKEYLPESFLFYKPKDIVAGDFYWMERAGDNILIAAADCTGHGVPGAMVSVVCSNALNRTVKEFKVTEPGKILDKVRELVLETFEKSEDNVQDGMDISLCCINTKTNETLWSGAYNSLWYIHNGEIIEVPADKQPIGKVDKLLPFNTHNLNLQKDDTLYLFTDGYSDQFGGPKGKKFKYKQLQELLLANAAKTMDEQKKILESTLDGWKGGLEQVDDILIIGIRV